MHDLGLAEFKKNDEKHMKIHNEDIYETNQTWIEMSLPSSSPHRFISPLHFD